MTSSSEIILPTVEFDLWRSNNLNNVSFFPYRKSLLIKTAILVNCKRKNILNFSVTKEITKNCDYLILQAFLWQKDSKQRNHRAEKVEEADIVWIYVD